MDDNILFNDNIGMLPASDNLSIPPASSAALSRITQRAEASQKEFQKTAAAIMADEQAIRRQMSAVTQDYQKRMHDLMEKMPNAPTPPDPKEFQQFSGMMILAAALAGRATREPLTAALNAYASGVKGFMSGQEEQWKTELQNWKNNMDKTLMQMQQEQNDYRAIMQDTTSSLSELKSKLEMAMLMHKDDIGLMALEQRGILGVGQLQNQREKILHTISRENAKRLLDVHAKSASLEERRQAAALLPVLFPNFNKLSPEQQEAMKADVAGEAKDIMREQNVGYSTAIREAAKKMENNPLYQVTGDTGWKQWLKDTLSKLKPGQPETQVTYGPDRLSYSQALNEFLKANPGMTENDPEIQQALEKWRNPK
jgi:hypothetical protein